MDEMDEFNELLQGMREELKDASDDVLKFAINSLSTLFENDADIANLLEIDLERLSQIRCSGTDGPPNNFFIELTTLPSRLLLGILDHFYDTHYKYRLIEGSLLEHDIEVVDPYHIYPILGYITPNIGVYIRIENLFYNIKMVYDKMSIEISEYQISSIDPATGEPKIEYPKILVIFLEDNDYAIDQPMKFGFMVGNGKLEYGNVITAKLWELDLDELSA